MAKNGVTSSQYLFDDLIRSDASPASSTEPEFAFLNRSAWRSVDRMRVALQDWFSRYPASAVNSAQERQDLRARFRSRDNRNHHGAFFELFIHELLLRIGCGLFVHPEVPGTSSRPDFLVTPVTGGPFYLEATAVAGVSEQEEAAAAIKGVVQDAINRIKTNDFFLLVTERGSPRTPPKVSKLRAFLQRRLDALDPDEVTQQWDRGSETAVPKWEFKHEGWTLSFQPLPKKVEARSRRTRVPIGSWLGEARWIDGIGPVREALSAKGKHLAALDLPLVVAINARSWDTDRDDITAALFGKEAVRSWHTEHGEAVGEPEHYRQADGLWFGPGGPRYRRIVAVLAAQMLYPWTVCNPLDLRLYHNPYVDQPLDADLSPLAQATPGSDGQVDFGEGQRTSTILGLPNDWPEMGQKI